MIRLSFYLIVLLAFYGCTKKNDEISSNDKPINAKPFLFALNVIDIDSVSKWYTENLGFEQLKKNNYPDYNMTISFLKTENVLLELIQSGNTIHKDSVEKPDNSRLIGIMKMGFITKNYEVLYKKLKSNNVHFSVDTVYDENTEAHYFVVYDCEQNPIQIFSESKSYDEKRELEMENSSVVIKPHLMAIFTDSISMTKSWYENNLEFKLFWSKDIPEHQVKVRILQQDNFNLELLQLNNLINKSSVLPDSINVSGISKVTFLSNTFDSLYTKMSDNQVNMYMDSTKSNSDWATKHFIVFDDNNNFIQIIE